MDLNLVYLFFKMVGDVDVIVSCYEIYFLLVVLDKLNI